ncbi:5-methyltetrahydropteroyltriglutamate--homocysteine methyltransferase [Acorus calamus]|uniref:5-methyltetrahydropteroyltriglutamate--homocysteine S-methyltransferase n=1 Tax=Acorus calamus TaxID=4465 RepID=A0AAV9C2J9_ACOCL|nr:5-methyltetrahydropteroyltriglutamate--homocysteine methyltransferase [Acorus calamus]
MLRLKSSLLGTFSPRRRPPNLHPQLSLLYQIGCNFLQIGRIRAMASHIVGYPRIGPKRELKFALEAFWDGKSSVEELQNVAKDLRISIWKQMADAGTKFIPSNTFSYYDQMLDTTAMLGAVPPRYEWTGGEIGFDTYFSMARGNSTLPAMEMTKWFDTNYHYIVPELGPDLKFSYASHKAVTEYKEAKELGVETVPVLIGPVSYLLLSKSAKDVDKSFSILSLLGKIIPIYKEVLDELKTSGATWVQFDEPVLVMDLDSHKLNAFQDAYAQLEESFSGLNVLVQTYFADVLPETYKVVTTLNGVSAIGLDLVRGEKTIELLHSLGFPSDKYLFAGIVDGRNIWATDLSASLKTLKSLEEIVGKDKLIVSTSCSLLHTAVDLVNETKLDDEIKSWLAFAAQKIVEVNALSKALFGEKDEAFFSMNTAAQASRKASPRVNDESVRKMTSALKNSNHRRTTPVTSRPDMQQKRMNLPMLPTTTIGSFPQTIDLRRIRREYKANKISEDEYKKAITEEINKVIKLQEELDINVLVHGEPERNDMVEYFGEQLKGFAFTVNGWVQSYGSRCVKPPIIYGDMSRPKPMTVFWSTTAQSMTTRPIKGMLTGPVTILNWSFVRNDQPRFETCYQIALAIKNEVEDLEAAGIQVIQIDEAALREGLPLRKSEQTFYLEWAVHSFRITNCGVKDTTQIHTHMCYSNFNIIVSIIDMDADVITIENSRSDQKLLSVFREGVKYGAGIGPGVYDIHSPLIPSTDEIADRITNMLGALDMNVLWVNPDCGLKTRKYAEVQPALTNMVAAAKLLRAQLSSAG